MYRRYYGRRHRMRTGTMLLILLLSTLLLVSCVAGSNVLWVRGLLGLDVGDYAAEPTEQVLKTDGETACELRAMVELILQSGVHLQGFSGTGEAVRLYRDAILNGMLRSSYTLYTGDRGAQDAVQQAYPYLGVSTLIAKKDFENTVFRYFGGTEVFHESGEMFSYLDRAGFYTSPIQALKLGATVTVIHLEETAHTYRMEFVLSNGNETSSAYNALFVKREDGTAYWKALEI